MFYRRIFIALLVIGLVSCNGDDDGDDMGMNQTTVSSESELSVEISQDGSTVEMLNEEEVIGTHVNNSTSITVVNTGNVTETFTMTLYADEPGGTYSAEDSNTVEVVYTNSDIQGGVNFISESGELEISRYEQVGEDETGLYYEMDGTFDVTASGPNNQQALQITGSFQDVFVSEAK